MGAMDRETVIKKLAVRIQSDSEEWNTIELPIEEAKEIFTLLKEQQPMLIDVNQMKQLADGTDVWLEAKDDREVFALTVARPWIGYYFDRVENGTYRCWTARPTDEQKKSVPWTNT